MIINILKSCKQKREDKNIKPFTESYLSSFFPKIKEVDIDCPDKNNQQKFPDYFLVQSKILVEIKEVHEKEELENSILTGYNTKRLQEELDKHTKDLKFLKGIYFLNFPWHLKIKKGQEKIIANDIINALRNNQKNISVKGIGNFEVISNSEGEKNEIVLAASAGSARSINPPGTIHQNIGPKINTANKQLEAVKANRKILLLVNKYFFGDRTSYFIEALAYSYKDLLNYNNIDEIWLQFESASGQFSHELLYNRNFLISFDKGEFKFTKKEKGLLTMLFEKWFYPISKLGDEYKEKLFFALKKFLKEKKLYQLFTDKFVREEMVRFGIWLAEKERFNDVVWIIDKFIDDPNPEEPEKYSGDPKLNYHQQIINGEDPSTITTVLGHLAWVIQKIAVRKNYIINALDYTKKLLSHKNLYVKKQALIPLIEIAGRRQWIEDKNSKKYKEFRDLVFDILENYSKYPAIAKYLSHVFYYFKDLTTEEALKVVKKLKTTDESAPLFIYFGVFRERHYKKNSKDIKGFDSEPLKKELIKIIKNKNKKYNYLRSSIAWNFWEILKDHLEEFNSFKDYIEIFSKQNYVREIINDLLLIVKDNIDKHPNECLKWFNNILEKSKKFLEKFKKEERRNHFWDDQTYYNEIMEKLKTINGFKKEKGSIEKFHKEIKSLLGYN